MASPNRNQQPARQQQQRPRTENEEISLEQRMEKVLAELNARKAEIAGALSSDMPFDVFFANINQALRNNPDLLLCTFQSLVNACVKSAYDGLRIDGREAAIVAHNVKVSKNPDRWEQQAQYFPMVFGLIQQVYRGGEVVALEVEVVYEADQFQVTRGTNPEIIHYPSLEKNRGAKIAVYSVATLKGGYRTAIFMRADEVEDVRKEAKTKFVWERWEGEMWKKTVIRRHRKTLPMGGRNYIDAETIDMFPQFQPETAQRLAPPPPRPTRQALEHQGQASGTSMDFGHDRDGVVVEQERASENNGAKTSERNSNIAQTGNQDDSMPEDDAAWVAWVKDIEVRISRAKTAADVEAIRVDEQHRIANANDARSGWVKGMISDRLADFVSDTAEGEARAAGETDQGQESQP